MKWIALLVVLAVVAGLAVVGRNRARADELDPDVTA